MPRWPKRRPNSIILQGRVIHLRPLCRKHGLDPSYVSKILRGQRPIEGISLGTVLVLARALNCTVEDLMILVENRRIALGIPSPHDSAVLNTLVG